MTISVTAAFMRTSATQSTVLAQSSTVPVHTSLHHDWSVEISVMVIYNKTELLAISKVLLLVTNVHPQSVAILKGSRCAIRVVGHCQENTIARARRCFRFHCIEPDPASESLAKT